jgi:pimeloyl-ACP methyl ester carboxylesterase
MPDLSAGEVRFHYASAPEPPRAPAIVFLHGAGANHAVWLAQLAALRDRAWVVVPDLPGHGRSSPPPDREPDSGAEGTAGSWPSIDQLAGIMIPFLEGVTERLPSGAARQVTLAGHSMGGAIALTIALSRPDLLAALVLVGSGARLAVSPQILDGLETAPAATLAMITRWAFAPGADPDLIVTAAKDLSGTPVSRTLADFRACNAFDLRERIGAIAVPTLVVCGAEDRMTPPKYSTFLAERIPGARLCIVPGAGHAVMSEAPDALSSAIAGFIGV